MRSLRSPSFLRPAKTILVPGMYFLGFSRYSKRVSSLHSMPLEMLAVCQGEQSQKKSSCRGQTRGEGKG